MNSGYVTAASRVLLIVRVNWVYHFKIYQQVIATYRPLQEILDDTMQAEVAVVLLQVADPGLPLLKHHLTVTHQRRPTAGLWLGSMAVSRLALRLLSLACSCRGDP